MNKIDDAQRIVGICDHYLHEGEEISEDTFEYKGCWNCWHFGGNGVLISVGEAADYFNVSNSTIIRWIKKGKLRGRLYTKIRPSNGLDVRQKYYVENPKKQKFKLNKRKQSEVE